jgi:hypothetical protein
VFVSLWEGFLHSFQFKKNKVSTLTPLKIPNYKEKQPNNSFHTYIRTLSLKIALCWRNLSLISLNHLASSEDFSVPYELDYNGFPILLALTRIQGPDGVTVNIETLVIESETAVVAQGKPSIDSNLPLRSIQD